MGIFDSFKNKAGDLIDKAEGLADKAEGLADKAREHQGDGVADQAQEQAGGIGRHARDQMERGIDIARQRFGDADEAARADADQQA